MVKPSDEPLRKGEIRLSPDRFGSFLTLGKQISYNAGLIGYMAEWGTI